MILKCSREAVHQLVKEKKIRAYRLPSAKGAWQITEDALKEFRKIKLKS